jgi:hypothetical protein
MYFGGFIFCITDENKLGFGYYANNQNQPFIYGVSDIPINAWTHVKGVFDYSTKLMSLYVNGHLDSASTVAYPYVDSEAIEAIGNNHWAVLDGLWRPFHGIIDELKIWRIENHPPSAPSIDGPSYGFSAIAYQWNFRAVDPDNNDIFYQIDWGDGNVSVWYGSYNSGEVMSQSHAYSFNGKYTIKAKVKDIYGQESDWAILTVTMPYSFNKPIQLFLEPLFQRFPTAFPLLRQLLGY